MKKCIDTQRYGLARIVISAIGVSSLAAFCAYIYLPSAFSRFVTFRNYEEDKAIRKFVHRNVASNDTVFFNNGMYLYWITHRYPSVPFINTTMQTTHYLDNNVGTLGSIT